MIEQLWFMECLQLRKLCKIFLNDCGVVLQEHLVKIFWNKFRETSPGQGLVIKVQEQEGSCEGVQTLPVDEVGVVRDPGLQYSLELPMSLGRGQELVVLVTPRDVHLDLPVHWGRRVLVN